MCTRLTLAAASLLSVVLVGPPASAMEEMHKETTSSGSMHKDGMKRDTTKKDGMAKHGTKPDAMHGDETMKEGRKP